MDALFFLFDSACHVAESPDLLSTLPNLCLPVAEEPVNTQSIVLLMGFNIKKKNENL